jgi:hypothetical protein
MFEDKRTYNGVKIILPPINQPRPVSQRALKKIREIMTRPHTVPVTITPLERLKALRKLRRQLNR